MALSRLVYFSTNNLTTSGNIAAGLKQILATAISNNTRLGVTGGLLFNRNYFIQVLEGDSGAVTEVFTNVSNDTRHSKIVLVEIRAIRERQFGAWSMGFSAASELSSELLAQFGIAGDFNPAGLNADQIAGLVLDLVSKAEGVASSGPVAA